MIDEQFSHEVDAYVDQVWEDLVADLGELVAIESVENTDEACEGEPWGHAPRMALDKALEIADRLGLETTNCEGYLGFADLKGASEKYIATIAHTDVVPVGHGWHFDPLKVTRKDGYLIGRGVIDDKGPCVVSLYVAKFFKDRGVELPYTLRCIIGNNEETSMLDVEYYNEHYPQPAFLFTPDADFPLCYGEKGGYSCWITSAKMENGVIVELDGGTAGNAIPGLATATVKAEASDLPAKERIDIEDAGEGLCKLTAHGKPGHASLPEGTINAIGLLVDYLLENNLCSDAERDFLEMEKVIFASTDGSSLGIDCKDDYFTPLTHIGGTIRTKDGRFIQSFDSRYPTCITGEKITEVLTELAAQHNSTVELDIDMVPFLTDPKSEAIQTLWATYKEMTGDETEPFTIGGGTYARHFARACSFGPNDPREPLPSWVGPEHGADEGVKEDQLKLAMRVYINAIARLMELDLEG